MQKKQIDIRLSQLKSAMNDSDIAVYIIPMNDYHGSEYIGEHFKLIRYFSGFTGSAGTLIVTQEESYLWTDGRYFLQAGQQLSGTGIKLQKMGEKDVPTISEFVLSYFEKKGIREQMAVGFDGRLMSVSFADKLEGLRIVSDKDLAGDIWNFDEENRRPDFPMQPVWRLDTAYTGVSATEKLSQLRADMKKEGADVFLLSTLDDIAWLTNLRGSDIAYNPVFLSYMIITGDRAVLYRDIEEEEICFYLEVCGIEVRPYGDFYKDIAQIPENMSVWIDAESASRRMAEAIPSGCKKLVGSNPIMLRKAIKNETEAEHIRNAHIKDGVAVTKFLYWLKTNVRSRKEYATEISAAEKLIQFRGQQEHYLGESFAPIVAFADHGAIVHYSANEATDTELKPESFLLVDTGGHYLEGTTDITRTIVMGALTDAQKRHYTAVLQGNLRLANAYFKKGLTGANLDYLAREPLYRQGLDFNHGTGHGVGYLLNVHEGPNAFRMRQDAKGMFEAGMVTSDEPGFYPEGQYGIRLENLILCREAEKTEYGQFLCFETLTMVPFDPEAIDIQMFTEEDKKLLNAYHRKVYEAIADKLTVSEREWLSQVTAPI
ncbi:MAG: aminopeptidase P family protein [Lachnospiraceae bacterium]|nr:aminopeptidase P family protein [Lachnospiraceae bacterium]